QKISQYKNQQLHVRDSRSLYFEEKLPLWGNRTATSFKEAATARSFLFVCYGNIMRSPMCEALMRRAVLGHPESFNINSAGLNAVPGRRPHPWAVTAAAELGIRLEPHRARALTNEMVDNADLIFVMDFQNRVDILSRFPRAMEKLALLGAFRGPEYADIEIR